MSGPTEFITAAELRQKLRSLKPVPWFVWQVRPRIAGASIIAHPNLPWPYLQPKTGWGRLWVIQSLSFKEANKILAAEQERVRKVMGWAPDIHHRDRSLGSMFCIAAEMNGRGGPYEWLFTPPVYRFCDLDKLFPWLATPNNGVLSGPFDFWVQPDVFMETGEILQGSPIYNASDEPTGFMSSRPLSIHKIAQETERGQRALELVETITVALDAWIERYERSGETRPDARFAFTWEELRARAAAKIFSRCNWREAGFDPVLDQEPDDCDEKPVYRYKLHTMQTWAGALCGRHARELMERGREGREALPYTNLYDFEVLE